jgi:tRNA A37 threonylcarbamoyladenosine dehydratase
MLATIGVGAPTVQDITKFQESKDLVKYLPKGFKLNVDTPFDTRMAMLYSTRMYYANLVKTSKKDSDLMVGYGLLYPIDAVANLLKATMITVIFGLCAANKIIKKVKYDESKDPPPKTQKVEVVMK